VHYVNGSLVGDGKVDALTYPAAYQARLPRSPTGCPAGDRHAPAGRRPGLKGGRWQAMRSAAVEVRMSQTAATNQLDLGEQALHSDGDLVTAREAFGRAYDQAEHDRDPDAMARAALGLGGMWVHERRSAVDAAKAEARQRQALAEVDPRSPLA